MSIADDIYAASSPELAERKIKRLEARRLLQEGLDQQTPRALRANQSANALISLLRDFIPRHCAEAAHDELLLNLFQANFALVEVPPEHDALREAEFEKAMHEHMMKPVFIDKK